jgi:hypothetical protein
MKPTDQLTLEHAILADLRSTGSYTAEMDHAGSQGPVDIQWAAHRAARALGIKAQVNVRELRSKGQSAKTVLLVRAHNRFIPERL